MADRPDTSAALICELCGREAETFKREGSAALRSYSSVCRDCIREHFAPTSIVVDQSKAGPIAPSDWTPAAEDRVAASSPERVLAAISRLQEETARTWVEPLVTELVEALAADTTTVELRQEIAFRDAEIERLRERC